jgi:hypothetical protein
MDERHGPKFLQTGWLHIFGVRAVAMPSGIFRLQRGELRSIIEGRSAGATKGGA